MLLLMLQFITFARLGATAGAINFSKGELIPSSPVATFDGSDLMISIVHAIKRPGSKLPSKRIKMNSIYYDILKLA